MKLENPSNYQHALQLFCVLKNAALNGILRCPHTFAINIIIIVFFLDHITKLVHVNPIRHGGGGRHIVPTADCYGSIRDLEKALDIVKKAHGEKG